MLVTVSRDYFLLILALFLVLCLLLVYFHDQSLVSPLSSVYTSVTLMESRLLTCLRRSARSRFYIIVSSWQPHFTPKGLQASLAKCSNARVVFNELLPACEALCQALKFLTLKLYWRSLKECTQTQCWCIYIFQEAERKGLS